MRNDQCAFSRYAPSSVQTVGGGTHSGSRARMRLAAMACLWRVQRAKRQMHARTWVVADRFHGGRDQHSRQPARENSQALSWHSSAAIRSAANISCTGPCRNKHRNVPGNLTESTSPTGSGGGRQSRDKTVQTKLASTLDQRRIFYAARGSDARRTQSRTSHRRRPAPSSKSRQSCGEPPICT